MVNVNIEIILQMYRLEEYYWKYCYFCDQVQKQIFINREEKLIVYIIVINCYNNCIYLFLFFNIIFYYVCYLFKLFI